MESLEPDAVALLGDNQYPGGQLENFMASYGPTWGRFKSITHPAPGNHEYEGVPTRDSADWLLHLLRRPPPAIPTRATTAGRSAAGRCSP